MIQHLPVSLQTLYADLVDRCWSSSEAKSRKDLAQAEALLEVLVEDRPYELQEVWNEALRRGPKWEEKLLCSAGMLTPAVGERLLALTETG